MSTDPGPFGILQQYAPLMKGYTTYLLRFQSGLLLCCDLLRHSVLKEINRRKAVDYSENSQSNKKLHDLIKIKKIKIALYDKTGVRILEFSFEWFSCPWFLSLVIPLWLVQSCPEDWADLRGLERPP